MLLPILDPCPHTDHLIEPSLRRRAQIIVAGDIVAPPLRERSRLSCRTEHSKGHDKQCAKTCTIESAHDHVGVVPEEARSVVTQVELREETGDNPAQDYASLRLVVGNVASVLNELGQVQGRGRDTTNARHELKHC
jgi:hypothetical protein